MKTRKFWRNLTRVHKWAGLVLGVQLVLWFASGLFMSFFDIDKVRGDHLVQKRTWSLRMNEVASFDDTYGQYISDQENIQCHPRQRNACVLKRLQNVELMSALGTPVWEFDTGQHQVRYSGNPATLWSGLSEDSIRGAARSYYQGDAKISKAVLFTDKAPKDFRKSVPIWQVSFDDQSHTRLYISPFNGELVNVRTRLWRTFDFMWMLHIMGYQDRDNINTWWLKLFAAMALLFALSGVGLVTHRVFLRPRQR